MKKLGFIALVFVLVFVSSLQAKPSNTMSLTTSAGKIIDINITQEGFVFKQYPGKTVLLNFFGPMCPPCIIEMPHLIELQKEHKDDLQIVAVQVQMPMENKELAAFIKKNNINASAKISVFPKLPYFTSCISPVNSQTKTHSFVNSIFQKTIVYVNPFGMEFPCILNGNTIHLKRYNLKKSRRI